MTVRHPAKWSENVRDVLYQQLERYQPARTLDPFAGISHGMEWPGLVRSELEPEWATQLQADALHLPFPNNTFDCLMTSPTYGNRMADHHNARDTSKRNTYRHTLGRPLHPNNSGQLQWGDKYKTFHSNAWAECLRVLKPTSIVLLNVSNHIRKGEEIPVVGFHLASWWNVGYRPTKIINIPTPRNRFGQNGDVRVAHEYLLVLESPDARL